MHGNILFIIDTSFDKLKNYITMFIGTTENCFMGQTTFNVHMALVQSWKNMINNFRYNL